MTIYLEAHAVLSQFCAIEQSKYIKIMPFAVQLCILSRKLWLLI